MNINESTLAIIDMQDGYLPSEGYANYMTKRNELISNIGKLSEDILGQNGRILIVTTINHGDIIPEIRHLRNNSANVVHLVKHYTSLLHFIGVPRYNQIQNLSAMKRALQGDELQIVGVNTSWCVLETAKSAKILRESDSRFTAKISVPFHATMNVPYPEKLSDDSALLGVNTARSIRDEYASHVGNNILSGKSLFEPK